MRRARWAVLLCALLGATLAGCNGTQGALDIRFDDRGWGGPNLEYSVDSATKGIRIERGMLINKDFCWAGSEFSFEFLDTRDLVWGFRLLDEVFAAARREALRTAKVKIGDREFVPGRGLPADQMWKFDTVLDAECRPEKDGKTYKVLDVVWYESILENGRLGVRVSAPYEVRIRPQVWNKFSAQIVNGKLTYAVNGEACKSPLQMDKRMNGRMGIFVLKGGPLCVRNIQLGAPAPRAAP
jgi:diadenosine tetraphosphatase ApaH/serine/threonine PP2A family protein phosphatase